MKKYEIVCGCGDHTMKNIAVEEIKKIIIRRENDVPYILTIPEEWLELKAEAILKTCLALAKGCLDIPECPGRDAFKGLVLQNLDKAFGKGEIKGGIDAIK